MSARLTSRGRPPDPVTRRLFTDADCGWIAEGKFRPTGTAPVPLRAVRPLQFPRLTRHHAGMVYVPPKATIAGSMAVSF